MLDLIKIRHHLHANPELSGQEKETSKFIVEELQKIGISKIHQGISQHSIVAEIDGLQAGSTLLFRCELDALPIQEANNFPHRSLNKGVSHQCGHDGHMATMLAFAQKIMKKPFQKGKILLLFQSAEEIGEGAKLALESGFFTQFNVDFAYAYHNLPSFPRGAIVCKKGIFTPSVESFSVQLIGKKCHASKPADGVNPANVLADFIQFMAALHEPNKDVKNYFVVTPIHINMGEKAYGISAGFAEIGYTIRTFEHGVLAEFKQKIGTKLNAICAAENLAYTISWFESFSANNNDFTAFKTIQSAAIAHNFSFMDVAQPLDFGEDFGLFTAAYKGAMFGIGSGENCPALHTVDYDFPDELIDIGSTMFYDIAAKSLEI